jgi:hypothetical protein
MRFFINRSIHGNEQECENLPCSQAKYIVKKWWKARYPLKRVS